MKTAIKKISIMSLALAGLILPERGMGSEDTTPGPINKPMGEPSKWYKSLEASILKGDVCAEGGIFRKSSGAACKYKDAAELYILICREKLASSLPKGRVSKPGEKLDKLLETRCGVNTQKWGSDFLTQSEENVIASTKKGYTNLYWLICRSQAYTNNEAISRVKAAACGVATTTTVPGAKTPFAPTTPTPQAKQSGPTIGAGRMSAAPPVTQEGQSLPTPGATPIPEDVKKALEPIPALDVQKALKTLEPIDANVVKGLSDKFIEIEKVKRPLIESIKRDSAPGATQEQLKVREELLQTAKKFAEEQNKMLETLRNIKTKAEGNNPPKELTPEQRTEIKKEVEEVVETRKSMEEEGIRENPRTHVLEERDPKTGEWKPIY